MPTVSVILKNTQSKKDKKNVGLKLESDEAERFSDFLSESLPSEKATDPTTEKASVSSGVYRLLYSYNRE